LKKIEEIEFDLLEGEWLSWRRNSCSGSRSNYRKRREDWS